MSMLENEPSINPLFDLYEKPNIVEEGHRRALGYQAILRELKPLVSEEELEELATQAINELDEASGHVDELIYVSGNVRVRTIDPKGIDIENEYLDPDAVDTEQIIVEDSLIQSLGYAAEILTDPVTIVHLATSGPGEVLSSTLLGDIYRVQRILIPIDGSAHARLATPPQESVESRIKLLEYLTGDLLDDIDAAILNSEDLTGALRGLSKIDMTDHKRSLDDDDVTAALVDYTNSLLDVSHVIPYRVRGVDEITVFKEKSDIIYARGPIKKKTLVFGTIFGVFIDERDMHFGLLMEMPFADEKLHRVAYPLRKTIEAEQFSVFRLSQR